MSVFQSLKAVACGAVLAVGLSVAAPSAEAAIVELLHDETYTVTEDTTFAGVMDITTATGGAEAVWATFDVYPAGSGLGTLALNFIEAGWFSGLKAEWIDVSDDSVLASLNIVGAGAYELATDFSTVTKQMLKISWDSLTVPPANTGALTPAVVISVAPIPLPASGLLLVGALGGIAALRRKKKELA